MINRQNKAIVIMYKRRRVLVFYFFIFFFVFALNAREEKGENEAVEEAWKGTVSKTWEVGNGRRKRRRDRKKQGCR